MSNGLLAKNGIIVTGSIEVQNAITASAFSGDGSALTGINTDTSNLATTSSNSFTNDQTITGNVVATGDSSRVRFLASTLSDLPSATDNHGMFAHVHSTGLGYYAHAGNWVPLATSESVAGIDVTIPSTYFNSTLLETQNITKNITSSASTNLIEITSSIENVIIDYRLSKLNAGSRTGTFSYTYSTPSSISFKDNINTYSGEGNSPIIIATKSGSTCDINITDGGGFNFSGFAKKFNRLTSSIDFISTNPISPPLDTYTGAAAAYSLRKLRTAYTGSAIRIRRASDNAETDIGFTSNGNLSTTSISAFCGSSNGFVEIWYDQSGNGNDVKQDTHASQPKIYDGSAVIAENGKASIQFDGSDGLNCSTDLRSTNGASTVIQVRNVPRAAGYQQPFAFFKVQRHILERTGYSGYDELSISTNDVVGNHLKYPSADVSSLVLHFTAWDGSSQTGSRDLVVLHENGSAITSTNGLLSFAALATGENSIGFRTNNSQHCLGKFQEVIVYLSDESSNRSGIETNINNYYSIYDTGLLEDYPNASAAYSVRQLTTAATSSMKIRRSSDNTEQVIGFTSNGDLNTGSIEIFCAGGDCYIDTWYDQSENKNNATQTDANKQPLIFSNNAVITENGKPCINFNGSSYLESSGYIVELSQNNASVFSVTRPNTATYLLTEGDVVSSYSSNFIFPFSPNILWVNTTTFGTVALNQQTSIGFDYDGTNFTAYKNSNLNGNTGSATINTETSTNTYIGAGADGATSRRYNGTVQELITYKSNQSSNRPNIETNINNYYSIYGVGLLEDYPSASAAYSVRQLTTAATASMNIRRTSDNTEQVIGFTSNGDLDTDSIETFCTGVLCYVDTWYDQSGNGNDAEQDTHANQPLIYSGSAVFTENGKPALRGASGAGMKTLLGHADRKVFIVNKASSGQVLLSSTHNSWWMLATSGGGNHTNKFTYNEALLNGATYSIPTSRTQVLTDLGNQNILYLDYSMDYSNTYLLTLGYYTNLSSYSMYTMQEIVFYSNTTSLTPINVQTNMNDYFNIY